jgi:hypothetical protein
VIPEPIQHIPKLYLWLHHKNRPIRLPFSFVPKIIQQIFLIQDIFPINPQNFEIHYQNYQYRKDFHFHLSQQNSLNLND